jgi:hypothetical protein
MSFPEWTRSTWLKARILGDSDPALKSPSRSSSTWRIWPRIKPGKVDPLTILASRESAVSSCWGPDAVDWRRSRDRRSCPTRRAQDRPWRLRHVHPCARSSGKQQFSHELGEAASSRGGARGGCSGPGTPRSADIMVRRYGGGGERGVVWDLTRGIEGKVEVAAAGSAGWFGIWPGE